MQLERGVGAAGMAMDVGEALLGDAEEGEFIVLREAAEIGSDFESYFYVGAFARSLPRRIARAERRPISSSIGG